LDISKGRCSTSTSWVADLELLKSGSTESAIVDQVSLDFGISQDLAETDVRDFLQNLKKCHLVEEHEPGVAF